MNSIRKLLQLIKPLYYGIREAVHTLRFISCRAHARAPHNRIHIEYGSEPPNPRLEDGAG